MAIARFFLASFLLLFTGFSVFIAGPKKNFDKQDDFDQLCRQFQEKNQKDETAFLQKFPLIDKLFSPKDLVQVRAHPDRLGVNYRSALDRAHNLVDACCRSLNFSTYSRHYTRLYDNLVAQSTFKLDSQHAFVSLHDDILSPDMDGVAGFLKIDTNDADLVAVNYRMSHFTKHLDAAVLNPDRHPHYAFSYDPKQDESFLKSIIANNAVSEEARQAAQRFLAQGKLYLLQKNFNERTHEYHRLRMAITEMLKQSFNPLFVDIACDRNSLDKIMLRVCQSKNNDFSTSDGEQIDSLLQKYTLLLKAIKGAIEKFSTEKIAPTSSQVDKQEAVQKSKNSQRANKSDKKKHNNKKKQKNNKPTSMLIDSEQLVDEQEVDISDVDCAEDSLPEVDIVVSDKSDNGIIPGDEACIMRRAIPTVTELEDAAPIKNYFFSTVLNWFSDSTRNRAITREIERYPSANRTPLQIARNVAAHTFPMAVDKFIAKLAHKFDSADGTTFYVIPGSLYMHNLREEQTGYYTWGVARNGQCFHRSFSLRKFVPTDCLGGEKLYNLSEIERVISDCDAQGVVSSREIIPTMRDSLEMTTNGLTVAITDHESGDIFKLIIPE